MNNEPPGEESAKNPLHGKTILFLNSDSPKKRFTFEIAKNLGVKIILVNAKSNWAARYCDHFIQANTYNHNEVIHAVKESIDPSTLDGAITFWEDDVPLLAKVCSTFYLRGNSEDVAKRTRDKYSMREALWEAGLPVPRYDQIHNEVDLDFAIEEIGFPAVVKPAWGSDSELVVRVNNEEEAKEAFSYVSKNATPKFNPIYHYNNSEFIFEEYVDGGEVNVEALVQNGIPHIVAISDKMIMKEPYFQEQGDYMPSRYDPNTQKEIKELIEKAIRALGISNSAVHAEVKITKEGGLKIIEIASRMGGDYLHNWVKTVWDIDLVECALKIVTGIPLDIKIAPEPLNYLIGKYFIPDSSGVISSIRDAKETKNLPFIHGLTLHKKVGDPVLVPPEGFESIGWLVAKGNTYAEAEKNLEEGLKSIEITVTKFDPGSSIGQTRRKNPFSAASITREKFLQSSRIEKIRTINPEDIGRLHIGILCNIYKNGAEGTAVEQDLMSVGMNIQKTLEKKGHHVTFFDMNESPPPFEKIINSNVDLIFNVCERVHDSSLLEPHAAAFLDILSIPYTGSNPQTLAIAIDKIRVKKLLTYHDIPTPKFDYVYSMDEEIDEDLRFPLIVKPANTDNSIGITNESVVTNETKLKEQLEKIILGYKRPALIEEYIDGDEIDVSIIGNEENTRVLPLSRSIFDDLPPGIWHIYPFDAKWSSDNVYSKIRTEKPAKLPKRLSQLVSEMALDTYNILDCHDYGRIEIRIDKEENPFVLELNPNPSINIGDCVSGAAELIGMSYEDFIEEIVKLCIIRYKTNPPFYHLQSSIAIV